ncbi:MAG: tRNA preQ1(34) S-adenosylmethionine ribosyltransferase-isomerase QueA [Symbiobacteriia bacterium]
MDVSLFDYELPESQIAQKPVEPRDASRLLVVHRDAGTWEHRHFYDLPEYLAAGDVLVANDTRVMPARLIGRRLPSGGETELLLLRALPAENPAKPAADGRRASVWQVLARPARRLRPGTQVEFGDGRLTAEVLRDGEAAGAKVVRFSYQGVWEEVLDQLGEMPLPPYIKERLENRERYQTVYARETGSAAAPTAGLHFTPRLLAEAQSRGVDTAFLTLHVGLGTFRPVQVEAVEEHRMHAEWFSLPDAVADRLNGARAAGHRVVAVGTTSARTLETQVDERGRFQAGSGWTDIFIYPGRPVHGLDALITNFHLPRSTLLMLVSAFAGRELMLAAYREAVREGYRFFSFGDAMLIL